jgi:RimJ/RimL family protein N-acetyltransferase
MVDPIRTDRLVLVPADADILTALRRGDAPTLRRLTGGSWPEPVVPPPLMGEDLAFFQERIIDCPGELGWWVWLVSEAPDGNPVGSVGLAGPPDADGTILLGYAVYPDQEGRGYATEALGALLSWASGRGATRCRATIPAGHERSIRVALRSGFTAAGTDHDDEVGEILVYERPLGS